MNEQFVGLIRDEQRQIDDVLLHVVIDADMRTVDADPPPGEVEFLRRCPIGIWDAEQPMRYIGTPDEWLEEAVSLYSVHPLEGMLETQATAFHTSFSRDEGSDAQQVFFVLDYCDGDSAPFSASYCFVGIDVAQSTAIIGRRESNGVTYFDLGDQGEVDASLLSNPSCSMSLFSRPVGSATVPEWELSLRMEGEEVLSWRFAGEWAPYGDDFGIGIRGAETSFDYLMVLGYAEEEEGDIPWPAWRAGYGPVEHFGNTLSAFGVNSDGTAYVMNEEEIDLYPRHGRGLTQIVDSPSDYWDVTAGLNSWSDYAQLAWETGGTAWNINELLKEDDALLTAFSTKIATVIAEQMEQRQVIELIAPECGLDHQIQWRELNEVDATFGRQECVFDVRITGDGHAHHFDLVFRDERNEDGEEEIGRIPVQIHVPYIFDPVVADPDANAAFTFAWSPGWADDPENLADINSGRITLDPKTGRVTWDPNCAEVQNFSLVVFDGHGGSALHEWTVTAEASAGNNVAPVITERDPNEADDPDVPIVLPNATVRHAWTYPVKAEDLNGDALRYYLVTGPSSGDPPTGLVLDRNMGELKWTPSSVGSYTFYVMVEDGFLVEDGQGGFMKSYDLQSFTVTVVSESPADRLPQVSFRGESLVCIGETFSWDITATDEDADILEYQILGDRPDAMVITKLDNNHARLIWRPPTEYLVPVSQFAKTPELAVRRPVSPDLVLPEKNASLS